MSAPAQMSFRDGGASSLAVEAGGARRLRRGVLVEFEARIAGAKTGRTAVNRNRTDARWPRECVGRRYLIVLRRRIAGTAETRRIVGVALQRGLQQVDVGNRRGTLTHLCLARLSLARCGSRHDRSCRNGRGDGDQREARRAKAAACGRLVRTRSTHRTCRLRPRGNCQIDPPSRRRRAAECGSRARTRTGRRTAGAWLTELERIWLTSG